MNNALRTAQAWLILFAVLTGLNGPGVCHGQETASTTEAVLEFTEIEPPPIRRIVMFNAGLSQMTHEGTVEGNQKIRMRFSEHDVDDVLKSLVFEDRDGGKIRSVEYNPAPDAQDVAATNLGPAMTLAQTLQEYRGEQVEIETRTRSYTGSILSVENRQTENAFIETLTIVNDDGFVSIPINEFVRVNFVDEKLRNEFNLAMNGLKKARVANAKEIVLLFEGQGKRRIRFSYNVDAPIWRMTYRLDLGKETSTLQGWAHIDNVSGVAWNQIELDLRSGRPQTFHVDLFAPVLAERMAMNLDVFDIPNDKLLITKFSGNASGGFGGGGGGFGGGGLGGGGLGGGGFGGGGLGRGPASGKDAMDINSGMETVGQVGRSNKMVRFQLEEKVNLGAGRSAMVPILKHKIPVGIYTMFSGGKTQAGAPHVAQIENLSSHPLIPGPVAIYRDGDFLGDGALPRIEVGRKDEFKYGTDLSVAMTVQQDPAEEKVEAVRFVDNLIYVDSKSIKKTKFRFKNDDSLARKILFKAYLEEEKVTPEPITIANKVGTYALDCDADQSVEQTVTEEKNTTKKLRLQDVSVSDLSNWRKQDAFIDDGCAEILEKIFSAQRRVDEVSAEKSARDRKVQKITQEQRRITDIVKVLKAESPTAAEYLKQLSETEKELAQARKEVEDFEDKLDQAKSAVQKLIDPN